MTEKLPIKILKEIDEEYVNIIYPIITNKEFKRRRIYHHHENRSVYGHSLLVSIRSYYIAKKLGLDYKSTAIAGLLHDFYYEDWQLNQKKISNIRKFHGFVHAKEALNNCKIYFPKLMNKKIENSILRHMFPLNFIPPIYLEGWIICLVDKYSSFEIFKEPKKIYKYLGLKKKEGIYNE